MTEAQPVVVEESKPVEQLVDEVLSDKSDATKQAIIFLNTSMPEVNNLIDQCSAKQLKRVITALTCQPFKEDFQFSYQHESRLYNVLVERERAKGILLIIGYEEQLKTQNASKQEEKKEETNGSTES